ncbi:MAG: ferritin-like domain-containing protein [Synechococcaceae cyanobacterium SM2_3_2]|nr:ferritin-like domain-containing protein [Synechococcaceae cyanobacterium SM2_3_2]
MPVFEGAEEAIGRILAVRVLELDVAAWLNDGLGRHELPEPVREGLLSNMADEARHDAVLTLAASKFRLSTQQDDQDAAALKADWEAHPDHPLVKAFVLENAVFFVILPFMRLFGDAALRTVARDIAGDETGHAAFHRQLAIDLKLSYSRSLDRLRRKTVEWLFSGVKCSTPFGNQRKFTP